MSRNPRVSFDGICFLLDQKMYNENYRACQNGEKVDKVLVFWVN